MIYSFANTRSTPEVCVFSSSGGLSRSLGAQDQRPAPLQWAIASSASLFSVLFPSPCRLCGELLTNISRLPVCEDCLSILHPVTGELCSICSERIQSFSSVSAVEPPVCGLC